jgi:hypothetical protein
MKDTQMESDDDKLAASLIHIGQKEGGRMFVGKPDRWWEYPHWRCLKDHVSRFFIKSDYKGAMCPVCMAPVGLTFPEDQDGPLPEE